MSLVLVACGAATGPLLGEEPALSSDAGAQGAPAPSSAPPQVKSVERIVDGVCLPQALPTDGQGETPCLVFETLPGVGGEAACTGPGLSVPDPATLAVVQSFTSNDPSSSICQLAQLPAPSGSSCASSPESGWCYVMGAATQNPCAESIAFSSNEPNPNAAVWLGCP